MNLSKSLEFFDPSMCKERIHIIGCGSVGSTLAELLARFGLTKMSLYDMDIVEPKNIANQMFYAKHVSQPKVDAVKEMIIEINPEAEIKTHPNGWTDQPLDGYVFIAVDNIDTRRKIVEANQYNNYVKAIFDFRTGLTDGQHYAADWSIVKDRKNLLAFMQFTHEEAKLNSQFTACNIELCVAPTVRLLCNVGVANFINFVKDGKLKHIITTDAFDFDKGIVAV